MAYMKATDIAYGASEVSRSRRHAEEFLTRFRDAAIGADELRSICAGPILLTTFTSPRRAIRNSSGLACMRETKTIYGACQSARRFGRSKTSMSPVAASACGSPSRTAIRSRWLRHRAGRADSGEAPKTELGRSVDRTRRRVDAVAEGPAHVSRIGSLAWMTPAISRNGRLVPRDAGSYLLGRRLCRGEGQHDRILQPLRPR